jgi:hypothetical protein
MCEKEGEGGKGKCMYPSQLCTLAHCTRYRHALRLAGRSTVVVIRVSLATSVH